MTQGLATATPSTLPALAGLLLAAATVADTPRDHMLRVCDRVMSALHAADPPPVGPSVAVTCLTAMADAQVYHEGAVDALLGLCVQHARRISAQV